ncbi:hypothetical protein O1L55_09065 [Streptomyces albulus]|nr:hypothetical protein [Streptomyces noursei]
MTTAGPLRRLAGLLRTKRADHVVHGAKTLIAALLTWGVVAPWSPDGRPYMAVATALLMVNASTVYQSVTKAAQNVVARVGGLLLASRRPDCWGRPRAPSRSSRSSRSWRAPAAPLTTGSRSPPAPSSHWPPPQPTPWAVSSPPRSKRSPARPWASRSTPSSCRRST